MDENWASGVYGTRGLYARQLHEYYERRSKGVSHTVTLHCGITLSDSRLNGSARISFACNGVPIHRTEDRQRVVSAQCAS